MLHNLEFLTPGQSWPPESERERIDSYIENQRLRDGKFEKVWPDLAKYLRNGETTKGIGFCLDYPDLIITKTCDLILGEPPEFCLPDDESTEKAENPDEMKVRDFVNRVNFIETLDAFIANVDCLGDAVLKLSQAETVKIANVCPTHWFPVTKRGTDDIIYHVLGFKFKEGDSCYLEVEIHGKNETGKHVIDHRLYRLNESTITTSTNSTIGERLPWANPDVKEIEVNPIDDFLVITAHNKSDGIFGKSSFKPSLKAILKKLIIRYALEQDVLDVFSRPTFFGPKEFQDIDPVTKKPVFRPGGYIGLNPDPHVTPILPAGLVWDAHLGENDISKRSLMDRLFDVSEMSPVLFAGNLAGMAESGTALRLRLTNTLAKCSRIRRKVDGAARKAVSIALQLESTPVDGLYIEWKDGLPTIPLEEAQRFSLWAMTPQFAGEVGGKYLLKEFGYDEDDAEAIMQDSTRNGGMGGAI